MNNCSKTAEIRGGELGVKCAKLKIESCFGFASCSIASAIGRAALAATALFAFGACASPTITIDSVRQRWPWNNKVDITYSVSEGQDVANGLYAKVEFTVTVGGNATVIDGNTLGASASDGTHTVTWNAPAGLRATDATMSAKLIAQGDVPSGNDYMIVDLTSGAVTFEGLLGTGAAGQTASNTRYNTDVYKTTKMVFRKIPKWADRDTLPNATELPGGGYPTGNTGNPSNNNLKYNQTARDYYVGVFMVTQNQYARLGLSLKNDSNCAADANPVGWVTWEALRGEAGPTDTLDAVVSASEGTFLQRLNALTGNSYRFDLPTFLMSELATRAGGLTTTRGNTLTYWWGSDFDGDYLVYSASNSSRPMAVGSKPANPWGLYDVAGNGFEYCLDDAWSAMQTLQDVFTPRVTGVEKCLRRNGGGAGGNTTGAQAASYEQVARNAEAQNSGFRVAMIVK